MARLRQLLYQEWTPAGIFVKAVAINVGITVGRKEWNQILFYAKRNC